LKAEFWHDRWQKSQIGFHNEVVNARLTEHWPGLKIEPGASVFVPLCGKSLDMHWLQEQGHPVVGVELSPIAVGDFFSEADLIPSPELPSPELPSSDSPSQDRVGSLTRYSAKGFDLYCGDLFDLDASQLSTTRACYDRGSLVALPPDLRVRYAEHLARILPDPMTILMMIVEYDQSKMSGPPHSVSRAEVEKLFGREFEIEELWSSDWSEAPPRFQARGLKTWRDAVLRLDRGLNRTPGGRDRA
jgi:thiopurine S-methyltransferase